MIDLHICDQNYMKFLAVGLLATTAAPYTNCKLWTIHIRLDASVCGEKLHKLYDFPNRWFYGMFDIADNWNHNDILGHSRSI